MDVLIHAVQHLLAQQDLVFHVALDLCFGSSQLIVHSLQFLHQLIFHFQSLGFRLLHQILSSLPIFLSLRLQLCSLPPQSFVVLSLHFVNVLGEHLKFLGLLPQSLLGFNPVHPQVSALLGELVFPFISFYQNILGLILHHGHALA